jgi:hypothetical protein
VLDVLGYRLILKTVRSGLIIIDRDPLIRDGDDDVKRVLRSILRLIILCQFGLWVPLPLNMPWRSMIVPPPQQPGMGSSYRQEANRKYRQYSHSD